MVFADLFFIYVFLPLCLICYGLAKKLSTKNIVLIVFSLIFYAWGEPLWILLLLRSGAKLGRLLTPAPLVPRKTPINVDISITKPKIPMLMRPLIVREESPPLEAVWEVGTVAPTSAFCFCWASVISSFSDKVKGLFGN